MKRLTYEEWRKQYRTAEDAAFDAWRKLENIYKIGKEMDELVSKMENRQKGLSE